MRSCKKIINNCGKIGDGFIILSEILQEINNSKFKIGEIETVFINRTRGESSVNFYLIDIINWIVKTFCKKFK